MLKLHETLNKAFKDSFNQDSKYNSSAENGHVTIEDEKVTFKLQVGPVNEYGLNGVQVPEILEFAASYLEVLNKEKTSPYNEESIRHIRKAIASQDARTQERIERGVEGRSYY